LPALFFDGFSCSSYLKRRAEITMVTGIFRSLYLVLNSYQYTWLEKLKEMVRFMLPFAPGRRYEVNRFGDFRPFLAEIKAYIKSLGS